MHLILTAFIGDRLGKGLGPYAKFYIFNDLKKECLAILSNKE